VIAMTGPRYRAQSEGSLKQPDGMPQFRAPAKPGAFVKALHSPRGEQKKGEGPAVLV
jgi:hypothetical protein